MTRPETSVVVVGAGLVGLATARAVQQRLGITDVVVLDKEAAPARHQSGRNSGVTHSGIAYAPGSDKARLAVRGRALIEDHCRERELAFRRCGKLSVATRPAELPALDELERRARANGVRVERLRGVEVSRVEPHAVGLAGLHVLDTGVADFPAVARSLADELVEAGGALLTGHRVDDITVDGGAVQVETSGGSVRAEWLVNCAGLQSDRIAAMCGARTDVHIVPFRGDYLDVLPPAADLVRSLIYPVPDVRWPFLGVHLTRSIDGAVHAGPTAVLSLGREAYDRQPVARDAVELLRDRALWRLARRYWRTGLAEAVRSRSTNRVGEDLRRMVPDLDTASLRPAAPGIRAQALRSDGRLVDDFEFATSPRCVHVLNAPSPAATASLAIAEVVADRLADARGD